MENNIETANNEYPHKFTDIIVDAGRLVLIEQHSTNTFDEEEVMKLTEEGLIVISVAYGQNLYRLIEDDKV